MDATFAKLVADEVAKSISSQLDDMCRGLALEMAKLVVVANSLSESRAAVPAPAAEEAKAQRAKPPRRALAAGEIDIGGVKNTRLYVRMMWAKDADFRFTFGGKGDPDETQRIKDILAHIKNIDKKTTEQERLAAEGTTVWDKVLSEDQREVLKSWFLRWKASEMPTVES